MKILFVSRPTILSTPGGDTVQMLYTAKYLRQLGLDIDIFPQVLQPNYQNYDLIHYFNITRPAPILHGIQQADKPYVLSTILVDYGFYKDLHQTQLFGFLTKLFGSDGIEYLKATAKHILRKEKIPYLPYLWLGQRKSIQKVLKNVAYILPNSQSEQLRLQQQYGYQGPSMVIPNGVDLEKFGVVEDVPRQKGQLICVGQIEPRKNQLNLIKAIKDSSYQLKIIGNTAPNHQKYYDACRQEAQNNVEFISHLPQEELMQHYLSSEIHILPSWFETTGLVSLEAAYLGCKIVVSPKGDTQEYFQDYALYCAPNSPNSIRAAIDQASQEPYSPQLRNLVSTLYNWKQAAQLTYTVYSKILK